MTEIIRTDAPRRSAIASLALGGLVVGVVWFSILSVIIALQVLSIRRPKIVLTRAFR